MTLKKSRWSWYGDDFLNTTSKAWFIKERDELYFCSVKDNTKRTRRTTHWKISPRHVSTKGLTSMKMSKTQNTDTTKY